MKGEIVKKPDELIKMRGEFSESGLKLSTYLISILEENKYLYEISIRRYLEKFDKSLGDFEKLYETALELSRKQFKMVDRIKKEFAVYNFFSRVRYKDGILTIKFDDELHQYLMAIKNNYLRYEIKNIMTLGSKYSIRLYEILKNKYEKTKKFRKNVDLKISVVELRELLSVPRSYKYNMFKKRILEKAKEELKEKTDIYFQFEEIKKGRKVDEIVFKIFSKNKYTDNRLHKTENGFKQFRQELLSKGNIFIKLNNQIFELRDGLLFKNGEILGKEKAWKVWKFLFKNRDKITLLNINEIENEVKNDLKRKILSEFKNKELKGVPIRLKNGEVDYINAELLDIQSFKNEKDFVVVLRSGNKKFKMRLGVNSLKNYLN